MKNRHIGIENEFKSFDMDGMEEGFRSRNFKKLEQKAGKFFRYVDKYQRTTDTAMRTQQGLGFYIDIDEIEIVTPPVVINKGFASRLTDLLMIGRDTLAESATELQHTGYSMHWNLGANNACPENRSIGIAVPFNLFALTPLSVGFAVREDDGGKRYEFLGDHIQSEEQIRATALLLGAFDLAMNESFKSPITLNDASYSMGKKVNNLLLEGRFTKLKADVRTRNGIVTKEMSAQQYLELFYQWIRPVVNALGTDEERRNLEAFIYGEKPLEFDRKKYFDYLRTHKGKYSGMYMPIFTGDENNPGPALVSSRKKRELPVEGRLLGGLIDLPGLKSMEWTEIRHYDDENGTTQAVSGVRKIYEFAKRVLKEKEKLRGTPRGFRLKLLTLRDLKGPIAYDPDNDVFNPVETSKIEEKKRFYEDKKLWFENGHFTYHERLSEALRTGIESVNESMRMSEQLTNELRNIYITPEMTQMQSPSPHVAEARRLSEQTSRRWQEQIDSSRTFEERMEIFRSWQSELQRNFEQRAEEIRRRHSQETPVQTNVPSPQISQETISQLVEATRQNYSVLDGSANRDELERYCTEVEENRRQSQERLNEYQRLMRNQGLLVSVDGELRTMTSQLAGRLSGFTPVNTPGENININPLELPRNYYSPEAVEERRRRAPETPVQTNMPTADNLDFFLRQASAVRDRIECRLEGIRQRYGTRSEQHTVDATSSVNPPSERREDNRNILTRAIQNIRDYFRRA